MEARGMEREKGGRIRVGYISPDFRSHPIGRFLLPLFGHHDHGKFEIFAYSDVIKEDEVTLRLRGGAEHWRNIVGRSDGEVAGQIRADEVDILVDLTMHMQGSRLRVFARKPAPIQVTYLAYCSTTGMAAIDYRLTDAHLDPPEIATPAYREKSIRLGTYWCYEAPGEAPGVEVVPPSVRAGHVTFGSLNNFCKVSPGCLELWMEILREAPGSEFIMHVRPGSHREELLRKFNAGGIDGGRIHFVTNLPLREYFETYGRIDIGLDPFPYTGGTTTCDALYMGVPVVTLGPAGSAAVHRSGVSLLRTAGMPELIAETGEGYVRIAGELARDAGRLAELRKGLRGRMERSRLMDAVEFARDVEGAFGKMREE
jgi:predicted O-linked N-acetylglucosamine transferase (SPINDLY family)